MLKRFAGCVCLVCISVYGCKNETPTPTPSQAASAASATAAVASANSSAVGASASGSPSASRPGIDPDKIALVRDLTPDGWHIPTKQSKPPSVKEWNAAEEHPVRGAKKLGCETKFVREWIRVSCRTNSFSGSTIKGLTFIKPSVKPTDFYEFVREDSVASVVFPIRRKLDAEVEFKWSDFSRKLKVNWSEQAKAPAVSFLGGATKDLSKPACSKVCGMGIGFLASCHLVAGMCGKGYLCDTDSGMCMCYSFARDICTTDY